MCHLLVTQLLQMINYYIFSEHYSDTDTVNDTGDENKYFPKKSKVTKCTKKQQVKSTTKGKCLTPSQILAKEKGKTLRWNRESYKGDTSAKGLKL